MPTWCVYAVGLIPAPYLLYLAMNGGLGREPVKALEHELGLLALQLMIAGLCVSPLRSMTGINLLRFRRAIGLLTFLYAILHLVVWAVLDVQSLSRVWEDIVKRPYITVGMSALLLMLPLAVTSNARSIRWMGAQAWRRLHMLIYPAAVFSALHFIWLSKGFQLEPLAYAVGIGALLAFRIPGIRLGGRIRPRTAE